ncbi:small-conductance mechanosensitive ion channel [Geotalea daltonii FRC-32]|uniref:Small-conductance mechanosensitive ion channel n=1 Tax=Geotalea daltonii (strain DSM 22248 / JCM 15807 / FRC-32) TaxID=316067 RepID=B9M2B9_GEODF|nr:mechanosensitive ion channel family protein [Geotalea daltonii]ACM21237.1 small-conductance mechanosensitive ion channel [Geotalea daltonii FRC-32]
MDNLIRFFQLEAADGLLLFWLKESLIAVIIFASFYLLALVLGHVLVTWGPRFTSFTKTDLDDRILRRVTPPVSLLLMFAGLYFAVASLPLPEKAHVITSGILFVINMIILTIIAYRAADEFLQWYAARMTGVESSGLRQLIPLVEKLISIFLIGTALIITLKHFNYDIWSIITALGIGSLAIGLAAKDTLANMISGFTLMLDRPFHIGDRIQLAGGQIGDVIDIGLRSTKIKTLDNTYLIIPNSELCNTVLINMAFPDVLSKGRINLGVAYGSDISAVKALLVNTALEIPHVRKDPAPEAFFVSFGDSALNVSLFFWVEDYTKVFSVTDQINCLIAKRFQENGVQIPYPTRTVLMEKD